MADVKKTGLLLDACQHCQFDGISIVREWTDYMEKARIYAARCNACGAQGPLRVALYGMDDAAVKALAADDWNRRINPEHLTDDEIREQTWEALGRQGPPPTRQPPKPRADPLADGHDRPGMNDGAPDGEGASIHELNTSPTEGSPASQNTPEPSGKVTPGWAASTANGKPDRKKPPAKAGAGKGKGAKRKSQKRTPKARDNAARHPIADRIDAYLERTGKTLWQADFQVNHVTIQYILKGKSKQPKDTTLDQLTSDLDRLEADIGPAEAPPAHSPKTAAIEDLKAEEPAGEVGPSMSLPTYEAAKVEELPNRMPPITRLNPLPTLTPPARCSKTT